MLLSLQNIPGPKEVEGAGNVEGDLASYQLKIHKEFGPLVRFKLDANTTAISVTDVEVLKTCSKIFDKPEALYEFLEPIMGKLLFLPKEQNKAHRKFMIDNFSPKLIQSSFDTIVKQILNELDNWISASYKTNHVISIQEKVKALAMRITILIACGEDFADSKKLGQAIHVILEEGLKLQYNPDYEDRTKQNQELNYLNSTIEQFIENRKAVKEPSEKKFFLDKLLNFTENEKEIRETLKEILMAGYHTIASNICWTLYTIAKHPEVANKIYSEIDLILTDEFQYEDLSKFTYLPMVIKEALRIYPAGPYTARKADQDIEILGYQIPKGTTIFYPIWAVHMSEQYWHEPEKFNPDRFKGEFNRLAFMPFGFGVRSCPGTNISSIEVLLITSLTLKKLRVNELPDFKPEIYENFVLTSRNDIQLKITPSHAT